MKATIEIPDELYRKVKAKTALLGRAVREVTIELYQRWLDEAPGRGPASSAAGGNRNWIEEFIAIGRNEMDEAPPGPSARELLEEGRCRLDPRT